MPRLRRSISSGLRLPTSITAEANDPVGEGLEVRLHLHRLGPTVQRAGFALSVSGSASSARGAQPPGPGPLSQGPAIARHIAQNYVLEGNNLSVFLENPAFRYFYLLGRPRAWEPFCRSCSSKSSAAFMTTGLPYLGQAGGGFPCSGRSGITSMTTHHAGSISAFQPESGPGWSCLTSPSPPRRCSDSRCRRG